MSNASHFTQSDKVNLNRIETRGTNSNKYKAGSIKSHNSMLDKRNRKPEFDYQRNLASQNLFKRNRKVSIQNNTKAQCHENYENKVLQSSEDSESILLRHHLREREFTAKRTKLCHISNR